ncbi:MAG: hypothetical protein HFE60_09760 [Anaerotignum sp.]|jgi:hypothetical protein|nr:hypothetical protein [Anaerotignum sp.]
MELWVEILSTILKNQKVEITFPSLQLNAKEIVELECYKALKQIKEVLDDDTLNDVECFERIEKIVCLFETLGSDGGSRHDFG